MSRFDFQDLLGSNVVYIENDNERCNGNPSVTINFGDFKDTENGGSMPVGFGTSNYYSLSAIRLLYLMLLLLQSNQAAKINDDPAQLAYVSNGGRALGTGARSDQGKQSFLISFFGYTGVSGVPSADYIG